MSPATTASDAQIGELIRKAALRFGDSPCLTEGTQTISFREFDARTDRLGQAFLRMGLGPGDRAAVLLPNSIDCLVSYYALAKAGIVRVSLNTREGAKDHNYKIGDSGARAVIYSGALTEQPPGADLVVDIRTLVQTMCSGEHLPCRVDRRIDAPYRLGYTGGTTGRPKAVTLTTRGELAELSAFLIDLVPDLSTSDTFLHAAPIAHASGAFFLPALVRGARSLIMPKFDPGEFIQIAQRERANMTFLVPTMLAMILELPSLASAEFAFRRIAYGASPISPSVLGRAQERFGSIFTQTYGQAESPMVITCLRPEEHSRTGSCGRPFSFVDVAIVDEEDRFLGPGESGEIVCRGPQTMAYYWNRPEETATAFRNGWLHTGDIGRMDEEGFFYILDRKNDMLISGGYNVYPREVEDVLLAYEGVIEAAVIGLPDEKWGDRVHAVVTTRPGVSCQDLLAFAAQRLADYKRPKAIEIWAELPKSSANKISRRVIRDAVIERRQGTAIANETLP